MPIDPDHRDVIREALEAADAVDARAIDVTTDGEAIVLRGTVPTFEESTAAAAIAGDHAEDVRNELRVDVNAREGLDEQLRPESDDDTEQPDDLVADTQASLDENVPWDPPHEEVTVPTRAESRGVADRGPVDDPDAPDAGGEAAGSAAKSLPEMTPEELSGAAHPEPREEESDT